jgi:predicted nucleic acid-binding protein
MRGEVRVVDASVVAALLFGEPGAGAAARSLRRMTLAAPALLRYEVGSVCRKKIDRHPGQEGPLRRALGLLHRLDLREFDVSIDEVVALARETGLTVHDAAYLWLAEELGVPLVTLDGRLRRVLRRRR